MGKSNETLLAQRAHIYQLMEDNEYRREVYPHYGCLNDWFIAYNELSEAIVQYLKIEETND